MMEKEINKNIKKIYDDIPEIPDIRSDIYDAAVQGKLIVFIGAGVSKIVGCPLWQEFARLMLKDLYERECINYYEFKNLKINQDSRKLLSICKKIYKEKNIELLDFKPIFQGTKDKKRKYGKIYEDLYAFNAIYLTTNYDIFLDQVLNNLLNSSNSTKNDKNSINLNEIGDYSKIKIINEKSELLTSNLNYKNILHLHGSVENSKTMIISIADYLRHYEKGHEISILLEEIFQNFTVLFVGYGLDEYEVMEFLLSSAKNVKRELKHFMLYPAFNSEKNLLKFQDNYYAELGVELIPFQIDKRGHNQLALIIKKWAKQIGPKSKPQNYLERRKIIDELVQ